MSAASTGVRFTPGPFKYNGRVAAALVPALLVSAGLGGRAAMGIFTIGTMLWYIMDAMQYREGAFTVVSDAHAWPLMGVWRVARRLCLVDHQVGGATAMCGGQSTA